MVRPKRQRHVSPRRRRDKQPQSGSGSAARASARDTAMMAVVALAFIGAFWFALSRPSSPRLQATAETHASLEQTSETTLSRQPSAPVQASDVNQPTDASFPCDNPQVTDGDTIRCGPLRVRLASIDAPEMPGHCRRGRTCVEGDPYASKAHLERLISGGSLSCRQTDTDRYGRIIALCDANGRDLSCAQVEGGHAIVRYGELTCATR